jgi:acetyl-CoA synthetase
MIHIKTIEDHEKYSELARRDNPKFWGEVASSFLWKSQWESICSGDFLKGDIKWFSGAKLNITENCLDRHAAKTPRKLALIWEPGDPSEAEKTYTYLELQNEVEKFALTLQHLGVKTGDRVVIYMAMVPELLFAVLACARLGAVHCVVFGGFSAQSLAARIDDSKARFVIATDGVFRAGKVIDLKGIVDEALLSPNGVKACLVIKRTGQTAAMLPKRDYWYHEVSKGIEGKCPAVVVEAEHPLFILYTSGSTGKPKGLLHTTAGYMVYAAYTFRNVFQMEEQDIFWCTADLGWITGHSYLTYGPLLNGQTTLMFEGSPTWPDPSRFWKVIDRHKVTHFYTAPTAIRSLEAFGLSPLKGADLSSLKVLGSVGEPINEEAWEWYFKNIGKSRTPIVDTWWQTETGGIMISSLAGVTPSVPALATLPLPGIEPAIVDVNGNEIQDDEAEGILCIKKSWPGMARTVYGDHRRYLETYFSAYKGFYFTGDGAKRNLSRQYRITGRVDDIIIVSGHNIGTAEVEDALDQHPDVIESAVIGYLHPIKGQAIHAFLICTSESLDKVKLKSELIGLVNKQLGGLARPDKFQVVPGLPKTRSGKIMRRILRKISDGERKEFGDISTLLNPEVVGLIAQGESF